MKTKTTRYILLLGLLALGIFLFGCSQPSRIVTHGSCEFLTINELARSCEVADASSINVTQSITQEGEREDTVCGFKKENEYILTIAGVSPITEQEFKEIKEKVRTEAVGFEISDVTGIGDDAFVHQVCSGGDCRDTGIRFRKGNVGVRVARIAENPINCDFRAMGRIIASKT